MEIVKNIDIYFILGRQIEENQFAGVVPACAEVLRSRGLTGKVHILSHDCGPVEGDLHCAGGCDQFGGPLRVDAAVGEQQPQHHGIGAVVYTMDTCPG